MFISIAWNRAGACVMFARTLSILVDLILFISFVNNHEK